MSNTHYTADQLKKLAADYFISNPDADYLVASTHDGVFYRPENAGYAQAGATANGGQLVTVNRESEATVLKSQAVNVNIHQLTVHTMGYSGDLASFLSTHVARVANGEDKDTVVAEMLAAMQFEVQTQTLAEAPEVDSLASLVATALVLPGYFVEPGQLTDEPSAILPAAPEPEATTEPAPAPTARAKAAPKKAAAKTKASTKAAE